MPASSPPVSDRVATQLAALGRRIRDHRKQQKVSAVAAAEAAGMSRVTWHRIERGEPSVAMGAWLGALDAVGLEVELSALQAPTSSSAATTADAPSAEDSGAGTPALLRLADYPQLQRLAWPLPGVTEVTPQEALSLYERNWRHVDIASLGPAERALVQALSQRVAGGRLLV